MATNTTVRRATEADLPALGAMAADLVRFHHAIDPLRYLLVDRVEEGYRRWFRQELATSEAVLLVAETEGGPALGYAYGRLEGRDWNLLIDRHAALHDILVKPEARGLGLGRALLDAFCAEVKSLGAPRVLLHTAHSNETAQRLFREKGFRPTMVEMTLEL